MQKRVLIRLQVDGDTDVPSVQQDFAAALYQSMRRARRTDDFPVIKHPIDYQNERAMSNGVAKQMVNGVSNYVGKAVNATRNVNGITAQGNDANKRMYMRV